MARLTVIANHHARGLRTRRVTPQRVRTLLGPRGRLVCTESLDQLPAVMDSVLEQGPAHTLALMGGDGTLSQSLSALLRQAGDAKPLPRILLCPAGTFNYIARNFGQQRGALTALHDYLHNDSPAEQLHPMLRVAWSKQVQFGFFFAWGVGFRILQRIYDRGHADVPSALHALLRGIAEAGAETARNHLGAAAPDPLHPRHMPLFRSRDCTLSVDGHVTRTTPLYSLAIGTVTSLSLGLRPFARSSSAPEAGMQLVGHGLPLVQLLRHLPKLIYGMPGRSTLCLDGLCDKMDAHDVGCSIDEGFTIDGEIFKLNGVQQLRIQTGTTLRFVV